MIKKLTSDYLQNIYKTNKLRNIFVSLFFINATIKFKIKTFKNKAIYMYTESNTNDICKRQVENIKKNKIWIYAMLCFKQEILIYIHIKVQTSKILYCMRLNF